MTPMATGDRIDPRWRVLYLVAVALGVFFLRAPWQVAALGGVQAVLWLAVGLGARRLGRQIVKLWGFALFVIASYAFTKEDASTDHWVRVHLVAFDVSVNTGGAALGALMVLRVLSVVMASQVARA